MTTVADLMTRDMVTLKEEDDLSRAMKIFSEHPIRHLPVASDGKLVGMVSHRDALAWSGSVIDPSRFAGERIAKEAHDTFVAEVMVTDVVTVSPKATAVEAARLLLKGGFGSLPVVDDDDNLLGIVTETDLLRHLISDELTSEQRRHTPAPSRPQEKE
jgi:CBS domain-containing protein